MGGWCQQRPVAASTTLTPWPSHEVSAACGRGGGGGGAREVRKFQLKIFVLIVFPCVYGGFASEEQPPARI